MSRPTHARLSASGVVLHVRQAGSGPVVLLLHGFPDSCELWHDVTPLLVAAGFRVIAPDLRGFGQSEAPASVGDYALGHVVADLRALIGRLAGDAPVRVIGHDWGAVAGWCLALEHPQLVRSQVALSVGHPRQYAVAGLEQKLKGLYTLAWQVPGRSGTLARATRLRGPAWLGTATSADRGLRAGPVAAGPPHGRPQLVSRQPAPRAVPALGEVRRADARRLEQRRSFPRRRPDARFARRMQAPWRYERIEARGTLAAARAAGARRGARAAVVRADGDRSGAAAR